MQGYHTDIPTLTVSFFFSSKKFPLHNLTAHYLFYSSHGYFYSREQVVCLTAEAQGHLDVKKTIQMWLKELAYLLKNTFLKSHIFESLNINFQKRSSKSHLFSEDAN